MNGSEVVTDWVRQGSYWSSSGHHQNLSDASWLPDPGCGVSDHTDGLRLRECLLGRPPPAARADPLGALPSVNTRARTSTSTTNVIVLNDNPQSWVGVFWDQDLRIFTSNYRFQGNAYYAVGDGQREDERYWRWDGLDLTWAEWQSRAFDTTGFYIRT